MAWPQEIETGELKLLHAFVKGCHAEYSLICKDGLHEIKATDFFQTAICVSGEMVNKNHSSLELRQESHLCTSGHFSGPGKSMVEDSWEICASKDLSLSLLTPVLDLTWDVEIPAHTSVEGSIDAFGDRERWRWKSWEILNAIFFERGNLMSSLAIQLLESRMFPSVVARRISRVGESSWKRGGTEEGRLGPYLDFGV